jgi:hypothetical protein
MKTFFFTGLFIFVTLLKGKKLEISFRALMTDGFTN